MIQTEIFQFKGISHNFGAAIYSFYEVSLHDFVNILTSFISKKTSQFTFVVLSEMPCQQFSGFPDFLADEFIPPSGYIITLAVHRLFFL